MNPVLTIAIKDLRLMARDRPGLVFTVLFPLLFGLFFGAIYADTADGDRLSASIGVIDQSDPESSATESLLQALQDDPRLTLTHTTQLDSNNQHDAVLLIPEDFHLWFDSFGNSATGRPILYMDAQSGPQAGFVQGVTTAAVYRAIAQSLADPVAAERRRALLIELADEQAVPDRLRLQAAANALQTLTGGASSADRSPLLEIEIDTLDSALTSGEARTVAPQNSFAITFPQAMMWAILGCVATFAVGLVHERNAGTLVRLRTMPLSPLQILAGKGVACMAVSVLVASGFVLLGRAFFAVKPVSYLVLFSAIVCVCFAFAGIMMLLAVLGRSKTSPGQLAWGVILIMAITGGGMLPLFFMPDWLRSISHLSPVKWGILAIEGGIWRGASMRDMLGPFAILISFGAIGFAIGARSFVFSERIHSH